MHGCLYGRSDGVCPRGRRADLSDPSRRLYAVGHDGPLRQQPDVRGHQRYRGVRLQLDGLRRHGSGLPGRPDRGNVREGRKRLPLCRVDRDVYVSRVLCVGRWGPRRRVLAHVQQQLHHRASIVRLGGSGNLYAGDQRLLGSRHAGRVRRPPELLGKPSGRDVHVQRVNRVHRNRDRVRWDRDRRDVRQGRERLFLRRIDANMRVSAVVRGVRAEREVRAYLHQCLHARADALRHGGSRDVHPGHQRLLGLRAGGGLRRTPELHDKRRGGGVHVQREFDVHGRREGVRDNVHLGDLREGRARVHLRVSIDAFHQWRMQRRSVLHQPVHDRSGSVRDGRARDVRDAAQRVRRMGKCGGVPGGHAELQCRRMRDAGELSSQRRGHDDLRSGKRELLHESGGDGGNVRPDIYE